MSATNSTRVILAEADAAIARMRSRIALSDAAKSSQIADLGPGRERDVVASAMRIADDWERRVVEIVHEAKLAEAAQNFRQRWPALVRWREKVLANKRRARPSLVAAAYESLALECTLAGEHHLAAKAQQAALTVMARVRPIRPSASADVEAQSA